MTERRLREMVHVSEIQCMCAKRERRRSNHCSGNGVLQEKHTEFGKELHNSMVFVDLENN